MKKGYVYFLPPIIALVVFGVIFSGFRKQHDEKVAAQTKAETDAREKKQKDAQAALLAAYDKANADVEKNKQKKAEDEAKRDKEAQDLDNAINARNKAKSDAIDLTQRANSLEKDKEQLAKEVEMLVTDKKSAELEQAHVKKLVQEAQANVQVIDASLKKIQESKDAWTERMKVEQARQKAAQK